MSDMTTGDEEQTTEEIIAEIALRLDRRQWRRESLLRSRPKRIVQRDGQFPLAKVLEFGPRPAS